jgi:glycosyltransferase involved in cell wall biosynthesis
MVGTDSLSVIVPALNEEAGLEGAVTTILEVVARTVPEHEILIFDDGSTDRTGAIAEDLARKHASIRVFHHGRPHGLGGVIRAGWQQARMQQVMWVDGQGVTSAEALERILAERSKADLVVPYAVNQKERDWLRRSIARAFRGTLNLVFGLDLHQYTHLVVAPREVVCKLRVRTDSHALQAEALVKMIKSGCSYVQVGVEDRFRIETRRSKAFRLRNVLGVGSFLFLTIWDVYFARGRPNAANRHRLPLQQTP